ncbi:MAG: hypothetical protein D6788_02965 [Planctomycetota bacterium]|nr:MAG: hypothetical protein D6788_02965 [Planctomycetota bacterium]
MFLLVTMIGAAVPGTNPTVARAQTVADGSGREGKRSAGLTVRRPGLLDRPAVPVQLEGYPGHKEERHDPPVAREVLEGRTASPAAVIVRGRFTSVQVNVDAGGNNIVGDAANEPSLAIDPTNPSIMAIGWRQFDSIASDFRQAGIAYSQDGGQTWTFPGVLDPGQFRSDPVLSAGPDGIFYYSSLSALDSIEVFRSFDGGVTWGVPVPAFGGDKQWIAVDRTAGLGSGHLYQIWNVQFTCCPPFDFTRSVDQAQTFQGPFAVQPTSMKWGTMDVGPDGRLYLAGTALSTPAILVGRSSTAQDPLQTPTFDFVTTVDLGGSIAFAGGPNPEGLLGQVWVATDHSGGPTHGNVYVCASVNPPGPDPVDVMFTRSEDGGMTWSPPVRINDDDPGNGAWQWFATMSVAPNGRIDVVWNDTRNTGAANLSETFYSFSFDGGRTWAANVPINPVFDSHVGFPNQNKMGDYYDMISDNDGANLAYSATFNGEQDVYFVRITADCNDNGIVDSEDVASGTSPDCDGNGIPDECQADCDGNGVADACELPPIGTRQDCNGNGILDACETGGGFDCRSIAFTRGGSCIEATVTLPNTMQDGELTVGTSAVPETLTIEILDSSCAAGGTFQVFLNDGLIASGDVDPLDTCSCNPPIQQVPVTDGALIASLWVPGGPNTIRFEMNGGDESLAWVRVVASTATSSETSCIFDPTFGSCASTALCSHGTASSPLIASGPAAFHEIVHTLPFTQSALAGSIDIANDPAGPYQVCVTTHTAFADVPDTLVFDVLDSACAGGGTYEFLLNGVSLLTTAADPAVTCSCGAPVQSFSIPAATFSGSWNVGGPNELTFRMTGGAQNLAWVRARMSLGGVSDTVCLFDTGSLCGSENLCDHNFVASPVDITVPAVFPEQRVCNDYTKDVQQELAVNVPCSTANVCFVSQWDGYTGIYADVWEDGGFAFIPNWGADGNPARVNIIDVRVPTNPQLASVFFVPPPNNDASPQDVKAAGGLLFVGLEGDPDDSVAIVDVRDPFNPVQLATVRIAGFEEVHNVFYDSGFLYLANSATPQVAIVDLTAFDPDNPPASPITTPKWIVNNVGGLFVHDITVVRGRMYAAAWDSLQIYDVSNVAVSPPVWIGSAPGDSVHSSWPTDDDQYVVVGEERPGGGIRVLRMTDTGGGMLSLMQTDEVVLPDAFSAHNPLIIGHRVYTSWYERGLQVHDIDPVTGALSFVAEFDTSNTGIGNWGVYPFGGEDRILLSDGDEGLYVVALQPAGTPCACVASSAAKADTITPGGGSAVVNEKVRMISFSAGDPGRQQAVRVTFVDLPPPFDVLDGTRMWVGSPRSVCRNSGLVDCPPGPDAFWTATLQCDPDFRDWSVLGVVHVFGEAIVPAAAYQVDVVDVSCDLTVAGNFSPPLTITTSAWGDVTGGCSVRPCLPPDSSIDVTTDVTAVLDRFRNATDAVEKPRADVEPALLDLLVNISDVTMTMDAFRGFAYPFNTVPDACP